MLKRCLLFGIHFLFLCFAILPASANTLEQDGLFAKIHTDKGIITAQLFYKHAPLTVMNFIGLAEGHLAWQDATGKSTTKPLYQNLIFHHDRDFMVQTGDPTGKGTGGPGFMFADEFHPELGHDKAGILSMANRGPNTNGSQFFITRKPAQWLDNRHSIFGEVTEGLEIVKQIKRGDKLERIAIIRVGKDAKTFNTKEAHKLAENNRKALHKAAEKNLPQEIGALDPTKVPKPEQPLISPGDFEFLVIGHTEMRSHLQGKIFYYDHKSALAFAKKLVRYARSKEVVFDKLIKQYSDMDRNTRTRNITDKGLPAPMKNIFRLKSGQISEPLDTPMGIYIFHRLPFQKK
ncbi:peptidylprolyl isomerase [Candidatus Parabeggiatoa sp. HSG14]|uniref:peptidylprolyl isomerase n=1 Tax=Candidatus Parabeggiatoa sp. HSG14 TaxID=3055593 RepID=UPI0025A83C11|nr:peptidylprolyl isomerase [Thiotrichales bacterium HSG14]